MLVGAAFAWPQGRCTTGNQKSVVQAERALLEGRYEEAKSVAKFEIAVSNNCECALTLLAASLAAELKSLDKTAPINQRNELKQACYEAALKAKKAGGDPHRLDAIVAYCSAIAQA